MNMNLFIVFDPTSHVSMLQMSLNWSSMLFLFLMFPRMYWASPVSTLVLLVNKLLMKLLSSFKSSLKKNTKFMMLFSVLFLTIMAMNIMGLFPYIFTSTSHILVNLSLALPIWICIIVYSMIYNTTQSLAHFLPLGTPTMLMPLMVLIETISSLIRPITLAVRLTANITAGHLLMTLLSSTENIKAMMMLYMMLFLLFILEIAVSFIQAYVFTMLSILYTSETT
uniref:ATP synthase subunit a n=1 Tax=Allobathynella sp. JHS-2017 TaxID=2025385 RepID=A0A7R6D781_9CRUS|nr:ATP synthase F0 subunit 6 [Allobathynella sp. JHS-2017]